MMLARCVSTVLKVVPERGCDFAAIFALREKLHDFALPRRQPQSLILLRFVLPASPDRPEKPAALLK